MANVVLVTGASAGIGAAVGVRLQRAGWTVVGASRRATAPAGCEAVAMDVDDTEAVRVGVAGVLDRFGRLDAVVAAAGFGIAGAFETTPLDRAEAQLNTNLWGAVRVAQAALPALRDQRGRLVFVGSIGGVIGLPFQAFYSASKFALEGVAEALAYEVEPFGVQVTVVEPGNVATEFTARRQITGAGAADPYLAAAAKAIGKMAADEAAGAEPDAVAAAVEKVLLARRAPRRVSVGKAGERVGLVAKRLLPYRAFEAAAKSSLGV